jgi:hypothetical protein
MFYPQFWIYINIYNFFLHFFQIYFHFITKNVVLGIN